MWNDHVLTPKSPLLESVSRSCTVQSASTLPFAGYGQQEKKREKQIRRTVKTNKLPTNQINKTILLLLFTVGNNIHIRSDQTTCVGLPATPPSVHVKNATYNFSSCTVLLSRAQTVGKTREKSLAKSISISIFPPQCATGCISLRFSVNRRFLFEIYDFLLLYE